MATTYLTRSISSTSTPTKLTVSFWLKGGQITSTQQTIFSIYNTGSANLFYSIYFSSNGSMYLYWKDTTEVTTLGTLQKFRDVNSWYHFVWEMDTTLATAADRIKMYINGERVTSFEDDLGTITQSKSMDMMENTNGRITIGRGAIGGSDYYFGGSLSHFYFTDGYAYDASTFGSTDPTTGEWKINTSPSITMGTNGFTVLKDGNTITDQSANSNNFTLGAGTLTNTEDCPSNVFATMNPLDNYYANMTYSQGNNTIVSDHPAPSVSTLGMTSGKYYFEGKALSTTGGSDWQIGIVSTQVAATSHEIGHHPNDYGYYGANGNYITGNSGTSYGNTYTAGDIIGCAVDLTNNKLYFSKNGTWQNSGVPTSGSTGTGAISITAPASTSLGVYLVAVGAHASANSYTWNMNFGNGYFGTTAISSEGSNASGIGKFEYDVPTGYTALSTKGLNE
jgi:hypothetical protein